MHGAATTMHAQDNKAPCARKAPGSQQKRGRTGAHWRAYLMTVTQSRAALARWPCGLTCLSMSKRRRTADGGWYEVAMAYSAGPLMSSNT